MSPMARTLRYAALLWFCAALVIAAFALPETVAITCTADVLDCGQGQRMNPWRIAVAGSAVAGSAAFVVLATVADPHGPHRPATGDLAGRSRRLRPSQARSG